MPDDNRFTCFSSVLCLPSEKLPHLHIIKGAKGGLPVELKTSLNLVLFDCGPEMDKCEKVHWLVYSIIGEDIIYVEQ